MIVARDIDRIRQTMRNQAPEHLWCDWQCCCWIPSGSLHTHPCQNISFSLAAFPTLSGLGFLLIQGGNRWEGFFQLSPCWQPGPARQGMQQAQAVFICFAVTLHRVY